MVYLCTFKENKAQFFKAMVLVIAQIIGWIATVFRSAGMLCKSANMVKYLVSIGNLCWMINGIMTQNLPLIVSNAICLLIMLVEIIKNKATGQSNVPCPD